MNSVVNYEILVNLKSMNILCIRQSSFYQIRLTVYQTDNKNNNVFAVPFLMLKSEIEGAPLKPQKNYDVTNTSEIDHGNNTFLTRKFIVRNIDEKIEINEMCIFKGSLLLKKNDELNNQLKIYAELLSYQQNDVEIVEEWTGYTLKYIGNSYCPMYFNSYKFTCNINSTVHLIVSSLSLEGLSKSSQENAKLDNVSYYKKYSRYLEESIEQLKQKMRAIKADRIIEKGSFEEGYQYKPVTYRYETFNESKPFREFKSSEIKTIQEEINKLSDEKFQAQIKKALYLLNQAVYQYWRQYQFLLTKEYSQSYEKAIKQLYYDQVQKFHQENNILVEETGESWKSQKSGLFLYPFQGHQTYLKLKKKDLETITSLKESKKIQLLVLVHGYQASSFDMEPISNYLRYKYRNILCLLSSVNEGKTEQQIEESAHRLAIEIKNYINSLELKDFQINFVCHSLGGIIGRASLKYLQLHKDKFNQFVSLCSPHLGYLYHSSTLISTSLWILNKVKKDPSMIELTLSDSNELEKTYIYQASRSKQMAWFNKIWLFGSKEDEYVPYWSAILEAKNFFFETESTKVYKSMLENLTKEIEQKIIRCEIIFNEKAKDLSNFIGRTAHIKILNYIPGLQLFSLVFTP